MNRPQLNVQPPNAMSGEPRVPPILPDAADENPLLGSLVILAEHFGNSVPESSLVSGLPLVNGRLTPRLFARAAARASLSARVIKRPLSDLQHMLLPAILLMKNAGAVVLASRAGKNATVVIPETGTGAVQIPLAKLEPEYTGYAICVKPEYRASELNEGVAKRGINSREPPENNTTSNQGPSQVTSLSSSEKRINPKPPMTTTNAAAAMTKIR